MASTVASSAAWRSSKKTTPGSGPSQAALITAATPSNRRTWAPGPSSGSGSGPSCSSSASSGRSSEASANRRAGMVRAQSARTASFEASRSSSTTGPYGIPASSSWHRAASTTAPAARARRASSSARRVFPIPASPSITARPPSGRARAWASTRAASASARPTSGSSAGPAAALARVGGTARSGASCGGPRLPSFTWSYRLAVSSSGVTPSSSLSVRTQWRYCASAAARSPFQAYRRISSRWAGSCSGSTSSHRRAYGIARSYSARRGQQLHQPAQRRAQLALEGVRLVDLPVVEVGTVSE